MSEENAPDFFFLETLNVLAHYLLNIFVKHIEIFFVKYYY